MMNCLTINFQEDFLDIEFVGSDLWISNIETGLHVFKQNIDSRTCHFFNRYHK